MNEKAGKSIDVQFGLDISRAIARHKADAAVMVLADFIRTHHLVVSDEALSFLKYSIDAQRDRAR